jgi:hypothetical protein
VDAALPPVPARGSAIPPERGRDGGGRRARDNRATGSGGSGVFYIGVGEQFDDDKLEAHPPGAVVVLPGGTPHFHWAKSGEYVTQVTAIGPLELKYLDPEDDLRNAWLSRSCRCAGLFAFPALGFDPGVGEGDPDGEIEVEAAAGAGRDDGGGGDDDGIVGRADAAGTGA